MTNDARDEPGRGYVYALICSLCSGAVPTLVKLLLNDNGPYAISGIGILLSGFLLLFYKPKVKPTRGSLPYLLFIAVVGAAVAPILWTVGLNQTTAVNAALLANGEILFTTMVAFIAFGERLSRSQAARGIPIVAGIVIVSTNLDLAHVQFLQGLAGNLLILASTVGWGLENNFIVAATKRYSVPMLSKFRNLIGGGIVTAVVLLTGYPLRFSSNDLVVLAALVLAFAGATYFFVASLQRLGAIRMILTYSLSTVFGATFAFFVLSEQVTPIQLAGGALIIGGVFLLRKSEKPAFVP
ncbi:MAG TPA: DMT family transporter [Nitrososphaerales archaeon]|nr:DMT family transporter [Nitrososphaerales archaeon]